LITGHAHPTDQENDFEHVLVLRFCHPCPGSDVKGGPPFGEDARKERKVDPVNLHEPLKGGGGVKTIDFPLLLLLLSQLLLLLRVEFELLGIIPADPETGQVFHSEMACIGAPG